MSASDPEDEWLDRVVAHRKPICEGCPSFELLKDEVAVCTHSFHQGNVPVLETDVWPDPWADCPEGRWREAIFPNVDQEQR